MGDKKFINVFKAITAKKLRTLSGNPFTIYKIARLSPRWTCGDIIFVKTYRNFTMQKPSCFFLSVRDICYLSMRGKQSIFFSLFSVSVFSFRFSCVVTLSLSK